MTEEQKTELKHALIPMEKYLEAGVHIGSRPRSGDTRKFTYQYRPDGLCILNVSQLNDRIRVAAKFISQYDPAKTVVIAGRTYAQKPAKKFAEMIGARANIGRFIPGMLTNPSSKNFIEPELVIIGDPPVDRQAIKESAAINAPTVALCGASALLKNVDLALPCNNRGKKALALVFWLLTRECLKARGIISSDKSFTANAEDFESHAEKEGKMPSAFRKETRGFRGRGMGRGAPRGRR